MIQFIKNLFNRKARRVEIERRMAFCDDICRKSQAYVESGNNLNKTSMLENL